MASTCLSSLGSSDQPCSVPSILPVPSVLPLVGWDSPFIREPGMYGGVNPNFKAATGHAHFRRSENISVDSRVLWQQAGNHRYLTVFLRSLRQRVRTCRVGVGTLQFPELQV